MASTSDDIGDSFAILQLEPNASEAEIKKAYRKLSLKFHPDKASKDVDPAIAAHRFHQINVAYETLMDPAARAKASQKSKEDAERRKRQEQYEGKRKAMADELERSEQEALRKKHDTAKREADLIKEIEMLREQGKKLREQKLAAMMQSASVGTAAIHRTGSAASTPPASSEPEIGPLDLSTRLRFPASSFTLLSGQPSDSTNGDSLVAPSNPLGSPLATELQAQFGPLTDLRFQLPAPGSKNKKRELTAFATFDNFADAWTAVLVGGEMKCQGDILEDVWIGWAGAASSSKKGQDNDVNSTYIEPARVSWYKSQGIQHPRDISKASRKSSPAAAAASQPNLASFAKSSSTFRIDPAYEKSVLQRLRDTARQKLQDESRTPGTTQTA